MEERGRAPRRSWGEFLVQEILRLSELKLSTIRKAKVRELLARIESLVDEGWARAFPHAVFVEKAYTDPRRQLQRIKREAVAFAKALSAGGLYKPRPITIRFHAFTQGPATPTGRGGHKSWLAFSLKRRNPLIFKLETALIEALKQNPKMQPMRCPICGLMTVVIRAGQKYCSSRCSRVAADRKRNRQEKRRLYLRRAAYARRRGVTIDQVRARKVDGKWKFHLEPTKTANALAKKGGNGSEEVALPLGDQLSPLPAGGFATSVAADPLVF